jgi:hypothetical protein
MRRCSTGAVATDESGATRQVLPAGDYQFVVEALRLTDGFVEKRGFPITVAEPDRSSRWWKTWWPIRRDIALRPAALSRDARLSYRLSKEATITIYGVDPTGRRTRLSAPTLTPPASTRSLWTASFATRSRPRATPPSW